MIKDEQDIIDRYRAYCDACQANELSRLGEFWIFPSFFVFNRNNTKTEIGIISNLDEIVKLYSGSFGPKTGVNKTVIDSQRVEFYANDLATIQTSLRHLAGDRLINTQKAIYGCVKRPDGKWYFMQHLSLEDTTAKPA